MHASCISYETLFKHVKLLKLQPVTHLHVVSNKCVFKKMKVKQIDTT